MSTGRALSIGAIAASLLDTVEGHYATAGIGLPERRYVAAGEPEAIAWDCEQLTVTLAGIGWGAALDSSAPSPGAGAHTSATALRHAVFAVTLVRCTPSPRRGGAPPDVAELAAAGTQFMIDAGLLSQAMVEFGARLRPGLPPEGRCQLGAVDPVGPSGGFHGLSTTAAITAARIAS